MHRRHFLASQGFGLAGLALTHLLQQDGRRSVTAAEPVQPLIGRPQFDLLPKAPPAAPRATAMISMFMQGGPSHLDLFDPKPELAKRHLTKFDGDIKYDNAAQASAKLFSGPWKFAPRGRCGMELSELLPGLAEIADDITLIRSMHTGVNNHGQSIHALQCGRPVAGRPSLGSWFTYGLGTENQNLPAFVALTDPTGLPVLGVDNWSNGWLPALYQGTVIRPREPRIPNLDAPAEMQGLPQQRLLKLVGDVNRRHLADHPGETDLAARIASYELAARMQLSAKEALDINQETAAIHKLYGIDDPVTRDYGTRCLLARRLIERGVRFVQIYTGNQTWDHHGGIVTGLPDVCRKTDRPAAALVQDLKARGLLDTTLVHWGGEMGRLPVIQNEQNIGRDHNTYGFSMWLAGGGIRAGYVHGATDELGHHAVEQIVTHYDYHATLFQLFGLDPRRVVMRRATGDGSLLDGQPGKVVAELLA
ncbi:MAG: DUF1501 domain-containing protein [Planctomycetota bacterium]